MLRVEGDKAELQSDMLNMDASVEMARIEEHLRYLSILMVVCRSPRSL